MKSQIELATKYKFILARFQLMPKLPEKYVQWFLLVDSLESLHAFLDVRTKGLVEKYWNLKQRDKKWAGHLSDMDQILMEMRFEMDQSRKTIVDDCRVLDSLCEGYISMFHAYGKLVINPNNSFRNFDETFEILETRYNDALIFPITKETDIRIIQWPNGKHYYAKIGDADVVDRHGKQKWDSHKEAQQAAEDYLDKQLK